MNNHQHAQDKHCVVTLNQDIKKYLEQYQTKQPSHLNKNHVSYEFLFVLEIHMRSNKNIPINSYVTQSENTLSKNNCCKHSNSNSQSGKELLQRKRNLATAKVVG
jgi:hypothetical protein